MFFEWLEQNGRKKPTATNNNSAENNNDASNTNTVEVQSQNKVVVQNAQ